MNYHNHFAHGVRVANFSTIALPVEHLLQFDAEDSASIVKTIRSHADLPYVFVVAADQAHQVHEVMAALRVIRSPCYPYALFVVDSADPDVSDGEVDIVSLDDGTDPTALAGRIAEYAAAKFHFDSDRLRVGNTGLPPGTVDVAIVGAGVTGLYAANRLLEQGISFCVVDKADKIGGIWSMYANTVSRVNTSECAYRLIENRHRSNRDHSATREILEDMLRVSERVSDRLYLATEVEKIEKTPGGYRIRTLRDGVPSVVESKGLILAINDRVGRPREAQWPGQSDFKGAIATGIADKTERLDWRGKDVVVVGMGAFAIENARTALEGGARHVTVVGRRHGTVCPKIIDYLNFATPYDENFQHDKKSNIRNMMYWKKLYQLSGATQPECWMGKIKHTGHTISVSDIWFVAHFLKKMATVTGEITRVVADGVIVNGQQRIRADILVNCIGFESNASTAKALCGYEKIYNNNYVDKDFMYLADAFIDDDAFNSFFGSSVLEMAKFYLEVFIRYFDNPDYYEMLKFEGIQQLPIEERKWSHYIAGAAALITHDPGLRDIAGRQVAQRTANFLEKHDLETYIAENKREWFDLHHLLAGQPMPETDCLPYVFEKLLSQKVVPPTFHVAGDRRGAGEVRMGLG